MKAGFGPSSSLPLTTKQQEYEYAQLVDLMNFLSPCLPNFKAPEGGQFGLAQSMGPNTDRYYFRDALPAVTALLSKPPYVTGPQPAIDHEQLADYPPPTRVVYLGDLYFLGDVPRARLAFRRTRSMTPTGFTAFRLGRMLSFLHPSGVLAGAKAPLTRCYIRAERQLKATLAPGASLGP